MLTIRLATQDDAAAIAQVHVASWRTTYAGIVPDEYLAALSEIERELRWKESFALGVQVYVAEVDGKVVGFISGGAIREPIDAYDGELYAIYLRQSAQGQKIGRQLLEKLAAFLILQGFHSMAVWVLDQNSAKRFYARTGAKPLTSKEIEIGGKSFVEVAYGWPSLLALKETLSPIQ